MLAYPVELTPDDNDTFLVTFPDIPEVITYGETESEALAWALDALETVLESFIDDKKQIPYPSVAAGGPVVILPVVVAGKVILHNTLIEAGKRKADLARMLNLSPTVIDRLLSLRHKSRIEQIETALAAFGKKMVVDIFPLQR
jgi:antitoxin HicB